MLILVTTFMSLARAEGEGKYHAQTIYFKLTTLLTYLDFYVLIEVELLGLRHRNETSNGPLTRVSMSGGLQFFIDGAGMDDQPHINSVMFEPTQTDPNLFAGPALNSKYFAVIACCYWYQGLSYSKQR